MRTCQGPERRGARRGQLYRNPQYDTIRTEVLTVAETLCARGKDRNSVALAVLSEALWLLSHCVYTAGLEGVMSVSNAYLAMHGLGLCVLPVIWLSDAKGPVAVLSTSPFSQAAKLFLHVNGSHKKGAAQLVFLGSMSVLLLALCCTTVAETNWVLCVQPQQGRGATVLPGFRKRVLRQALPEPAGHPALMRRQQAWRRLRCARQARRPWRQRLHRDDEALPAPAAHAALRGRNRSRRRQQCGQRGGRLRCARRL